MRSFLKCHLAGKPLVHGVAKCRLFSQETFNPGVSCSPVRKRPRQADRKGGKKPIHRENIICMRSIGDLVLLVMKTYSAGWLCSGLESGAHKPSQAPMAVLGTLPGFFNIKGLQSQTEIVGPAYRSVQMFEGRCRAEQSLFSIEDNGL